MVDMSDNEIQYSVADTSVILFSIYLMDFNILRFNLIDDQLTRAWDVNGEVCWLC
jgi:hypothetical protein